jgi:hypothetical protein
MELKWRFQTVRGIARQKLIAMKEKARSIFTKEQTNLNLEWWMKFSFMTNQCVASDLGN